MLPCTGLDPAERAVLEAALAQHASSPDSDGDSGRDAASVWQLQPGKDAADRHEAARNGSAAVDAAPAANGLDDVMEALCCPITHVRRCARAETLQQRICVSCPPSAQQQLLHCSPANCLSLYDESVVWGIHASRCRRSSTLLSAE